MTPTASTTSVASMASTASFCQKNADPDGWVIPRTQTIIISPFLWNRSKKIQFLVISDTLFVGGCSGQPMLLFWKLVDETQISQPPDATRHHNSTNLSIVLTLRAIQFGPIQYDTPCRYVQFWTLIIKWTFTCFNIHLCQKFWNEQTNIGHNLKKNWLCQKIKVLKGFLRELLSPLSVEFLSKISKLFGGENWQQLG
jgi:hypothetical protein